MPREAQAPDALDSLDSILASSMTEQPLPVISGPGPEPTQDTAIDNGIIDVKDGVSLWECCQSQAVRPGDHGGGMLVQASGGDLKRSAFRRMVIASMAAFVVIATIGLVSGTSGAAQSHAKKKSKAPGTLIVSEQVAAPGVNGTAYLVKYWSQSFPKDKAVEVTGVVVVPSGTSPAGGWPVVSWAHGTNGTNSSCAPSLDPVTDIPNVNNLLAQGWEVTATDYQGEGNPLTRVDR